MIEVVQDLAPVFGENEYFGEVKEGTNPGYVVVKVNIIIIIIIQASCYPVP